MMFHCLLASSVTLWGFSLYFLYSEISWGRLFLPYSQLSKDHFFPSTYKCFSLSFSPLLLLFLPLNFPSTPTLLLWVGLLSPSYHLIYRHPASAPIFSFVPSVVTREVTLRLSQVKPFPHALDPFLTPSQGPTPSVFSHALVFPT